MSAKCPRPQALAQVGASRRRRRTVEPVESVQSRHAIRRVDSHGGRALKPQAHIRREPPKPRPYARIALAAGGVALGAILLVVGCNVLAPHASPISSSSVSGGSSGATASTTITATASPKPSATGPVRSIVVIAALGESAPGTPSGLAWAGAQEAAARVGAASSLVVPTSMAELTAAPARAAVEGASAVVTVGQEAAPAALAAARAYPKTEFIEVDQTLPAGAPSNLHGLVFDEAEAGYLAGYVAASVSSSGHVGMVGDTTSDTRTINYLAGFRSGAEYASPSVKVTIAYAGGPISPDKGRSAAAKLVSGGADVVLALPDLTGIGTMREVCARKALIVAADTDAYALVPDVKQCVAASVRKRFDVAVRDAVLRLAEGEALPAVTVADVADGAIDVTEFHVDVPADLAARLAGVVAAMQNNPPRSAPAPKPAAP